jgi:hypothetical protein
MSEKLPAERGEENETGVITVANKAVGAVEKNDAEDPVTHSIFIEGATKFLKGAEEGNSEMNKLFWVGLPYAALVVALKIIEKSAFVVQGLLENHDKLGKWPGVIVTKGIVEPLKEAFTKKKDTK